jgi:hypothetical protein
MNRRTHLLAAATPLSSLAAALLMATGIVVGLAGCAAARTQERSPKPKHHVEAPQPSGGVRSIVGEVLGVDRVPASEQNDLTLSVRVAPGSDDVVSVNLGPGWYFEEEGIVFAPNDKIIVKGSHDHAAGVPTLVATEIQKDGEIYVRDPFAPEGGWQKREPRGDESPAAEPSAPAAPSGQPAAPPPTEPAPAPTAPETPPEPAPASP